MIYCECKGGQIPGFLLCWLFHCFKSAIALSLACCLFTVSHQITNTASFSAYPEDGIQYPVHDIFQFPHVITNNGGHYDPSESVFTCPVNGTYYFTSSVYTGGLGINYDTATSIIIYRDWSGQSEAYCRNNGPDPIYIQCGTSVVMNCNQGQRVFLGTWYIYVHMYGSRLSNFSGFLIQADTPPN